MNSAAKIAISLPRATLVSLERERRRAKRSRSAVIAEALDDWLRARNPDEQEDRYAAGYLKKPERIDEAAATAEAAMQSWDDWSNQRHDAR